MRTRILLSAAALAFIGTAAAADSSGHRYKWKDPEGLVHYSDNLPSEALQVGYDVINPQGVIVKHVDRAKTPEELKAADEAAKQAALAKQEAEQQSKADQQMLAAYTTEKELRTAQQAQLDMIDQSIRATEISLGNQEKSLHEVLDHAASLDRSGKPVPATLQSQIESLKKKIDDQKSFIARKQKEKNDTSAKFTAELDHYRDIRSRRDSN
ncbi:MAG TPA: DUF4124 domain-containing protein [Rudaea sp.]